MRIWIVLLTLAVAGLVACGDDDTTASGEGTVVVTTSILGEVVETLVGDELEVITIMPAGASPHEFQASARDAATMREADLLIVNGGGFEEGLLEVIDAAQGDGVRVYEASPSGDPHFFTDPLQMAAAVQGIAHELGDEHLADPYFEELGRLHEDVEEIVARVPPDRRVLVTNHDVLGPFAERYGFEVAGTVIPGGSTSEGTSAGALAALAEVVRDQMVPAVFIDASSPGDLADALAGEVEGVQVVELFTESLGEVGSGAATYLEMVRTNAERIADALAPEGGA